MPTLRIAALALALAASCASRPARPPQAPRTELSREKELLPAREKLPLAAREMLTLRMDRHGDRMTVLMESVLLLNYEVAQVLAHELASEPTLGRPAAGEKGTLSAMLPAAFFAHQDELAERAQALSMAAGSHDDAKLVAAFSELAGTCVACHSAYLYEDDELPVDEPWLHAPEGGSDAPQREPGKPRSASALR